MFQSPFAVMAMTMLLAGLPAMAVRAERLEPAHSDVVSLQQTATRVSVLVLANGGKFVGADIGGALITIRDALTQEVLASERTHGGSGLSNLVTIDQTLLQTIPESEAARFVATIPIDEPRLVEVTAYGPLAARGSAVQSSTTVWLLPPSMADDNRVVLTLRGLVVQLLNPPTHFLPNTTAPVTIPIRANVTMMCGCPIGPSFPWHPEDYRVQATIRDATGIRATVPLAFDAEAPYGAPSQFIGSWTAPAIGVYEITVTAHQLTHDNTGLDRGTFIIQ